MLQDVLTAQFGEGAAAAGVLVALIKLIQVGVTKWFESRKDKSKFHEVVERQHEIYQILYRLLDKTQAISALIIRAENGGGVPHPGRDLYASVAFEAVTDETEAIRDRFQRRVCDASYKEMLFRLLNKGHTAIDARTMDPGELKDLYEVRGVGYSELYLLHQSDVACFYLAVHWRTQSDASERDTDKIYAATRENYKIRHTARYKDLVRSSSAQLRDYLNFEED